MKHKNRRKQHDAKIEKLNTDHKKKWTSGKLRKENKAIQNNNLRGQKKTKQKEVWPTRGETHKITQKEREKKVKVNLKHTQNKNICEKTWVSRSKNVSPLRIPKTFAAQCVVGNPTLQLTTLTANSFSPEQPKILGAHIHRHTLTYTYSSPNHINQ